MQEMVFEAGAAEAPEGSERVIAEADLVNFTDGLQRARTSLKSEVNLLLAPWDEAIEIATLRKGVDLLAFSRIDAVLEEVHLMGKALVWVHVKKFEGDAAH